MTRRSGGVSLHQHHSTRYRSTGTVGQTGPAFVNATANTSNGSAIFAAVAQYPASITAGNLLVVFAGSRGGTSGGWSASTGAAGFTKIAEDPVDFLSAVFTKTASGSESGSANFATVSQGQSGAVMLQYSSASGLDGAPVFSESDTSVATATIPSITASAANRIWVAVVATLFASPTMTLPSGFTQRSTAQFSAFTELTSWDQKLTSSGASGSSSSTLGASNRYNAVSILVKT